VSDNGRGIDYAAIRKKALDRGMITADQLAEMSDHASDGLIFSSGITTRSEAADISGRGVGLNVVMSNVKKWGGEVELMNQPGQGTAIRLKWPNTNTLLTKQVIMLKLKDRSSVCPWTRFSRL
jgi:chemotaxis protein histidine kinase CheA